MTLLLAAAVTTVSGETNAIKQNISLAPGFKMSCTVSFDAMPKGRNMLVTKDREYLLRCDVAEDGVTGDFRFWPYVNGKWEPSVGHAVQIEPGRKYAIAAAWDGAEEMVCVDGVTNRLPRFGTYKSTADPLTITSRAGTKVTNLVIRSTHEPNPFFTGVRSVGLMLHVGEPMPFRAVKSSKTKNGRLSGSGVSRNPRSSRICFKGSMCSSSTKP